MMLALLIFNAKAVHDTHFFDEYHSPVQGKQIDRTYNMSGQ